MLDSKHMLPLRLERGWIRRRRRRRARVSRSPPPPTARDWSRAAGVAAQSGVAAADPTLLPLGSIVELDAADRSYNGIYTILDTGPEVQGREVDIYMWSCHEALAFGRQPVQLTVLRLGWNPARDDAELHGPPVHGAPSRRAPPLPSRPLPIVPAGD